MKDEIVKQSYRLDVNGGQTWLKVEFSQLKLENGTIIDNQDNLISADVSTAIFEDVVIRNIVVSSTIMTCLESQVILSNLTIHNVTSLNEDNSIFYMFNSIVKFSDSEYYDSNILLVSTLFSTIYLDVSSLYYYI